MENNWAKYVENTKESNPRPLLVEALNYVKEKEEALDLGAGAMNDVRYLVKEGFTHVTAVDQEPVAEDIVRNLPSEIVNYVISDFEKLDLAENKYDLINAQYSLPFNSKETFPEVWNKVIDSLKTGGVITGQFFGDHDGWIDRENMNFHTLEEAKKFLSGLEVIKLEEEETDRLTAAGNMKHWHLFHFIAAKK
jgi:tellurite methyltransferase